MNHDAQSPSGIVSLLDAVSYQPGAVVSHVLAKHGCGSLTLFAFDAGTGLEEHSTPHAALLQVLEGTGEIRIDGDCQRVQSGEIYSLPPGVPHTVQAETPMKVLLTLLRRTPAGDSVT